MEIPLTALIIEDSESDSQLILCLLKKAGYKVVSERVDTAEGMRSVLGRRPWDIVISDYNMSQFNRLTMLDLLRAEQSDISYGGNRMVRCKTLSTSDESLFALAGE